MENLELPLTTAIVVNFNEINMPLKFKNELNEFEIVDEDDEFDGHVGTFVSADDISNPFKEFLKKQNENYFGYIRGDNVMGNLSDSLQFYTNM